MRIHYRIILYLFFLCCISCQQNTSTDPNPDTASEGNSSVSLSFAVPEDVRHLVISAEAVVSAEDMETITAALTVGDGFVTGTIEEIPAGAERKFEIFVYGEDGNLTYYGFTYAEVIVDQTTEVVIQLEPQQGTGTVIITGTFGDDPGDGYALTFDGQDDFATRSVPLIEFPEFTIEAWCIMDAEGGGEKFQNPIFIHRDYLVGESHPVVNLVAELPTGSAAFDIRSTENPNNVIHVTSLGYGTWHHYAAVATNSQIKMYIDGELVGERENTQQGNYVDGFDYVRLGHHYHSAADAGYLNGSLDEIRVWNYPRSPADILENMHQELSGEEEGLVAYWPIDGEDGLMIYDHAGENHFRAGNSEGVDSSDPLVKSTTFPHN